MSRTGIIAPMPVEAAPLVPAAARRSEGRAGGFPLYQWSSSGNRFGLACSGVGLRRAAEAARCLLEECRVERVIVCGVAGGLAPGCRTGALVVPQAVRAYTQGPTGGVIAQGPLGQETLGPSYAADPALREAALAAARYAVLEGSLISVRGLVTSQSLLDWFREGLSATAIDMESAAVGEVCAQAGVPFLVVRALSDDALELARWDWAGLARARKGGRLALAAYFLRHPTLAARLWGLRRDVGSGARAAARVVLGTLARL